MVRNSPSRWRVTAYNVEKVQTVKDRNAVVGSAQDIEMGIVGDNMGGGTDKSAGQNQVIVRIGDKNRLYLVWRNFDIFAKPEQIGRILVGRCRVNLPFQEFLL